MSPFHEKVNYQVCKISYSRYLKCVKKIVDKEEEGRIIKKLNNKTDSWRKFPSLLVMIMKLRKQSHKRFIVPSESSTNQRNQGANLSLFQFPILPNSNQRAPPLRKSADPLPSSATLIVKWPGVWEGKSGQVKERRKGKKGKRKKEKSQEQIMGKIGSASQRETNQVSLFLLPTNKRSIHMEQQI